MKRFLPQTLRGWLIVIVLSALVVSQLVMFVSLVGERTFIAFDVHRAETFGRIQAVVARLRAMPPELRPSMETLAGSRTFVLSIDDAPLVAADHFDARSSAYLARLVGAEAPLDVRVSGPSVMGWRVFGWEFAPPPEGTDVTYIAADPVAGSPVLFGGEPAALWTLALADPAVIPLTSAEAATAPIAQSFDRVVPAQFPPTPDNLPILVSVNLSDGQWLNVEASPLATPGPASRLMIGAGLTALALTMIAVWGAGRVARPLNALSEAAGHVGRGEDFPLPPAEGPTDVKRAIHAFNDMVGRVRRTLADQRGLLQAVGHDLRTPLASLRIRLEFVEDADLRERMVSSVEEIERLTAEALEAARGEVEREEVRTLDLGSLVESISEDEAELGRSVTVEAPYDLRVDGRSGEIRRAVRNLIDNAIKHGGEARIRVERDGDWAVVAVADRGPGIPEADLARVVEPFVRLDPARSGEDRGHGLGLTIVKSIADRHAGALELANRPEGGLEARFKLPHSASAD